MAKLLFTSLALSGSRLCRTVQAELDRDPERKGYGVVIRVDKITDLLGQVLQRRD